MKNRGAYEHFLEKIKKKLQKKSILKKIFFLNETSFDDKYYKQVGFLIAVTIFKIHPGVLFIFSDRCAFLIYPNNSI